MGSVAISILFLDVCGPGLSKFDFLRTMAVSIISSSGISTYLHPKMFPVSVSLAYVEFVERIMCGLNDSQCQAPLLCDLISCSSCPSSPSASSYW